MPKKNTTPGARINRWLTKNPKEARAIAFAAISGLYLEEDDESILPEHDSYPRDSGSDYVDHVGSALDRAGISPLIAELQEAWVDPEDEEGMVKLSFRPQASVGKNIVDAGREGEETWFIPRAEFLEKFPDEETWEDEHELRDQMRDDSRAPRWVRKWSGPFEVELPRDVYTWGRARMSDLDCYKYKAEGKLDGKDFLHEGTVYAELAWDAGELAEEEVRSLFPGVVLKDDEPERGVTSSPQVFVSRDIVNRAVSRGRRCPKTGALLPEPIPEEFETGPSQPPKIERKPFEPPPLP